MEASVQWADSLLALERLFFLKLAVWGATAIVLGSGLLALARRGTQEKTPLISSLALVLIGGGALQVAAAFLGRDAARLRDLGSATSLDRILWLTAGIATGWTFAALLAIARTRRPDSAATIGAATGVALHGVAITVLTLQLARALVR